MKKLISVFMILALTASVLCLSGCRQTSGYMAVGFVHSSTPSYAFLAFYSLEGRYVAQMRVKDGSGATLHFSGELEKGIVTVHCMAKGQETELFTITDGGSVDSSIQLTQKGKVYIVIQTDGTCENGSFKFEII